MGDNTIRAQKYTKKRYKKVAKKKKTKRTTMKQLSKIRVVLQNIMFYVIVVELKHKIKLLIFFSLICIFRILFIHKVLINEILKHFSNCNFK